jgi:hypothetical protein
VKLKVIIEKMRDVFAPIDAAFIKKNKYMYPFIFTNIKNV